MHLFLLIDQLAATLSHRLGDERGQTAAEYIGIILVVAAIIAVATTAGGVTTVANNILTGIGTAISRVLNGGG